MKPRAGIIFGHCLLVFLVCMLTVFSPDITVKQASADTAKCETCGTGGQIFDHPSNSLRRHGLIRYTPEQIEAENRLIETAPLAKTVPIAGVKSLSDGYTEGATRNLLPLLSYDPTQRDQGLGCGSCWVWAGTGCLEVALRNQLGIENNKLSVQYFTSTYNGGSYPWACCGGNASYFASHYNDTLKKAIPWSNNNADYVDGSSTCYGSTAMPAGSISTSPNYPISSVTAYRIKTYSVEDGVNQATAIANIKNVLDQNKAIYFGFTLANDDDWDQFFDFWYDEPESYLWRNGYSCTGSYFYQHTLGHAVLCVGYDDTPEGTANDYWVMLNSWGTAAGRPNGLFRVPMYYDYDCSITNYGYSTRWWTIEPTFILSPITTAPTMTSPTNGAGVYSSTVNFFWSTVSGATKYQLQVSTLPDFSTLYRYNGTTATSFTMNNFPNDGTVYYWRTRAGNAIGWGPWNITPWSFTNGISSASPSAPTTPPAMTSPSNGAGVYSTTVNFSWSTVSGATKYQVQVSTQPDFSTLYRYNGTTATSFTMNNFPNDGTVYYWRTRAGNAIGWGPWNITPWSFTNGTGTVISISPAMSSPANGATVSSTSITFS
ncbi:MAG: C1 family peptidase, partial [Dehalococcoidia bacterium]